MESKFKNRIEKFEGNCVIVDVIAKIQTEQGHWEDFGNDGRKRIISTDAAEIFNHENYAGFGWCANYAPDENPNGADYGWCGPYEDETNAVIDCLATQVYILEN